WGNEIFTIPNSGGLLGVRTHAWGTFLATCRLTFTDSARPPIVLHRYIDFEMATAEPNFGVQLTPRPRRWRHRDRAIRGGEIGTGSAPSLASVSHVQFGRSHT